MKISKEKIEVIVIIVVIFFIGVTVGLWVSGSSSNIQAGVENVNKAVSLLISLVALIFALVTFFSIDAVDRKNKMDNNILEKTQYCPSYSTMIKYLNVGSREEYIRTLSDLVIRKPKIASCMDYSEWLQNIIDHIIWFAYYEWNAEEKNSFIASIHAEQKKYDNINSGVSTLLEENVKLIEQIVFYQENSKNNQYNLSRLQEVRYKLLPNPIAKTVYFDYLGLDYRRYAAKILNEGKECREFSKEYFETFDEGRNTENDEKCIFFIESAQENFRKAIALTDDDILWNGYLKYNLARCRVMKYLLSDNAEREAQKSELMQLLDDCVLTRKNVCHMMSKEGYLTEAFRKEYNTAAILRDNFAEFCK